MSTTTAERPGHVTPSDRLASGTQVPEGAPPRGRARELEGYRGLVGVTIVAFHVFQYAAQGGAVTNPVLRACPEPLGDRGRSVRDVGLVLTLSYARSAIEGATPQSARQLLFRRAVRILPLYWIAVTVVWAIRNPALPGDWVDLLEHFTFTQVFDRTRIFYTLVPTWSMSLEVIFYGLLVVFGLVAERVCARIGSRRARVRVLLVVTGLLSVLPFVWNSVAFLVLNVPFENWPVYFGPQARFAAFGVGMVLAVVAAARRNEPVFHGAWPGVLRIVGIGIVALAASNSRPGTWGQVVFHDVAAVGWFLLLASTVLGASGQVWSRVLSWPVLTCLGLISYSTYMWHEPIMMLLERVGLTSRSAAALPESVLLVVIASVGVGFLSYLVIEKPTAKLRRFAGP